MVINSWKKTYLQEKGITDLELTSALENKINKILYYLRSNKNFILLLSPSLTLTKKIIHDIIIRWVCETEKGFTLLESVSTKTFDEDWLERLTKSALVIMYYDPGLAQNTPKAYQLEGALLDRYSKGLPTLLEILVRDKGHGRVEIPFLEARKGIQNLYELRQGNIKIFKIKERK